MQSIDYCTLNEPCSYLNDRFQRMEFKYFIEPKTPSADINLALIKRGWRRFGRTFLRPNCQNCTECLNLRIKALEFEFSKSQKRVIRKNQNTKVILRKPMLSDEHLFLHDKYHKIMQDKKSWEENQINFKRYFDLYVDNALDFGFELAFFVDEKLVCVDLIDILDDGISSIYCFYDHDYSGLSLGKFSLLYEIYLAKIKSLKYIYLGYFVKNSQSLSYKADYSPNEILRGHFNLDEKVPEWR